MISVPDLAWQNWVALAGGVAMTIAGVVGLVHYVRTLRWARAEAVVEATEPSYHEGGSTWTYHVVFNDPAGRRYRGRAFDNNRNRAPGETVTVRYDPADPANAVTTPRLFRWVPGAANVVIGVGLVAYGLTYQW